MLVLVNTGVNIVIETLLESGTWVKRLSHFLTRSGFSPRHYLRVQIKDLFRHSGRAGYLYSTAL
jgi:hypothetical protein